MPDPSPVPWKINPPTSDDDVQKLDKLPGEYSNVKDNFGNPLALKQHTRFWFPDMSGAKVQYDQQGLAYAEQTWIAPWSVIKKDNPSDSYILPIVARQLMSWNREKFSYLNKFWDYAEFSLELDIYNLQRPLVVSDVSITPRTDMLDSKLEKVAQNYFGTSLGAFADSGWTSFDGWGTGYSSEYIEHVHRNLKIRRNDGSEFPGGDQVFPRMRSQFWQVTLVYKPDPYINRLGIRYAKVEIIPNLRMETLKNVSSAVIPTSEKGNPDFAKIDPDNGGDSSIIDRSTTGFPIREQQVTIRITYPWVSLETLLAAGPVGNPGQMQAGAGAAQVFPHHIPKGLYLGCINKKSFLGYPRGRVLYNSASIEESVSPVTGKIGYQVTHEFLVNPLMEWNQTRYTGKYLAKTSELSTANATIGGVTGPVPFATIQYGLLGDMVNPPWATGFVMQMDPRTGFERPYRVLMGGDGKADGDWQGVYPYPYKELNDLLYYGKVGDNTMTTKFPSEG
jgi:hypothetical protein